LKTQNRVVFELMPIPLALNAQVRERDVIPVKNWAAPLYWQLSESERDAKNEAMSNTAGTLRPRAQSPTNSLAFVAMTPCRVVDTRSNQGFTVAFGPPSLMEGASRTFPIQSSPSWPIPGIAEAYSFNVVVVNPGPLGFITVYPTGQPQPLDATLNDLT
jgi:hypothetical protein